jgi:hypothetical protein
VPLAPVFNSVNTIIAQGTAFGDVRLSVSRAIAERCDKRSVPEILKPGQNQPLNDSKDHRVETPNMSAPFAASSGPSNRHDGVRSRSP